MKGLLRDIFENHQRNEKHEDFYKVRKVPYKKDDMRLLENLMKNYLKKSKPSLNTASGFGGGGFHENEYPRDQRVMFKMSYSPNMSVHQKYLNTYMPQTNKAQVTEKPVLFGTDVSEYLMNMDDLHFKCIISPENQEVNLELLSREFIKRMEVLTGYKLYWRGCIHKDTGHRHAHICINGKDKDGKKVLFKKEMIRTTMRETLSYVATLMVGKRTDQEIAAARQNLFSAKRWTKLDESLESYGEKISLHNLPPELMNRLSFLSELKLAEKYEKYYTLKRDWKAVLVATGRYNTFLSEWQKSGGKLELYAGGTISGICDEVVTFDKDESWNDAVIVKDGEHQIYVPVWQLRKDNLIGKKIEISGGNRALSRQIRNCDIRIIDEVKRQKNGRSEQQEF